jgi:hypothetical protein
MFAPYDIGLHRKRRPKEHESNYDCTNGGINK